MGTDYVAHLESEVNDARFEEVAAWEQVHELAVMLRRVLNARDWRVMMPVEEEARALLARINTDKEEE